MFAFAVRCFHLLTAVTVVCAVSLCSVAVSGADAERRTVKDLEYGHALFHFFQEDYFESAARLLAAQEQGRLNHHTDDADLLLGGIYLSYGQQRDANAIFSRLLDERVDGAVRDRAWLYAAQIAYQRGSPGNALDALSRIEKDLEPEFEARKRLLHARILVEKDQFDLAVATLDQWRAPKGFRSYARYNLGVTLIRQGDTERGIRLLSRAASGAPIEQTGRTWLRPWRWFGGNAEREYDEGSALQDKINLALGFAYLKDGDAGEAVTMLDRVGEGMWSSKASLGQGWAAVELGEYQTALAAWETLDGGDPLDPAVQESRLGIPFAYAKLGDEQRALEGYRDAIDVFGSEIRRLESLSQRLVDEHFLDALLEQDSGNEVGWFWSLDNVPDDERGRYLYALMADHSFQEGLKNYRDLRAMRDNLDYWSRGIDAFDLMLQTRERRYRGLNDQLAGNDSALRLETLRQRVEQQSTRVATIRRERDTLALASVAEEKSLARLDRIDATLARVTGEPRYDDARAKAALLRGILIWRLNGEYAQRLWSAQKDLKALGQALTTATARSAALGEAQIQAPREFDGFDARIEQARPRVAQLQRRVELSMAAHERYLKAIAIDRFSQHANRLRAYLTEAQFALASTYDRLSYVETSP